MYQIHDGRAVSSLMHGSAEEWGRMAMLLMRKKFLAVAAAGTTGTRVGEIPNEGKKLALWSDLYALRDLGDEQKDDPPGKRRHYEIFNRVMAGHEAMELGRPGSRKDCSKFQAATGDMWAMHINKHGDWNSGGGGHKIEDRPKLMKVMGLWTKAWHKKCFI